MKITIEINMDNAAFEDNPDEVPNILTRIGNAWRFGGAGYSDFDRPIMDSNGNKVGKVQVTE